MLKNLRRGLPALFFLVFVVLLSIPSSPAQAQSALHIQNNLVVGPTGSRFIAKGVNVEAYRDYVGGCGYVTDNLFQVTQPGGSINLTLMINKFRQLGVNIVRLNYDYRYINTGSYPNLSKYLDVAQALANAGIYVMPADHSQTGANLANRAQAYPTFQALVAGFRSRGIIDYVVFNPFNEPANTTWSAWVTANEDILHYFRVNLGFTGVVMLDGIEWASENNATAYQTIMTYDAGLLGGTPNVGFENHWYPNIDITKVDNSFTFTPTYPIWIGELGQYNGTPDTPSYVTSVLNKVVNTGLAAGHNGVFGWIWSWCDSNKMTDPWDNYTLLNPYGQLYVDYYWTKVGTPPNTVTPRPLTATFTPTFTRTPTNTPTRTSTPIPTGTNTPTRTSTRIITATNTPVPVNTPTNTPTRARTATPTVVAPTTAPTIVPPTSTRMPTPGGLPPTPVGGSTIFLPVIADAYVSSKHPSANYGSASVLEIDSSPSEVAYLRFNVQGVTTRVARAILQVYSNHPDGAGFAVRALSGNTWGENTITFRNAPTPGNVIGSSGPIATHTWVSVDVTSYIVGNGTFDMALTDFGSKALSIRSRESSQSPKLIVSTSP